MNEFNTLYDFIDLAEKNRKYPANTAHGRRAALKLFDSILTEDERESLDLIQQRMGEIYLGLISKYKESYSIQSLNTYKGRLLSVIRDYKRYGAKPDAIVNWEAKERKYTVKNIKDDKKDTSIHNISFPTHRGVHKLHIALGDGQIAILEVPANISNRDAATIKKIVDSLVN